MPKTKKPTFKRIPWTATDFKTLRKLAGKKPTAQIARLLKRSEAAVRFKATTHSISLKRR